MAEQVTVANAYVQIMPSMEGATSSIADAILPGATEAGEKGGKALGLGLGTKAKAALAGVGGVLVGALGLKAAGSALMDVGSSFDTMRDTIIVGTGASGEALDALCDSAKNIATSVPISFEDAGDAVQDLNTRMGLTGTDLEEVGKRVAAAGKLIGGAVDVSKLTGSLNAFDVANEDVAAKMDYLFGVSQATGMGFNDLTGIIESNAPVMQSLGFSFEETANMAGLLDKAGMDASGTMSKMGKALVNLAEPGQSASEAFDAVIGEMQGYIEAGDEASALDVASKVFGTKGAAQFVGALQSGAFSLDEIRDSALGAGDGIMGTFDATASWPEKWEVLKNKFTEALEPLAGNLMEGATRGMEVLSDALSNVDPSLFEEAGKVLGDFIDFAIEGLKEAAEWVKSNWDTISKVFESIGKVLGAVSDVAKSAIDAIVAFVSDNWDTISSIIDTACQVIEGMGEVVGDIFTAIGEFIGWATEAWEQFNTDVSGVIETVCGFFDALGEACDTVFGAIADTVDGAWSTVSDTTTAIWDGISSTVGGAWDGMVSGADYAFGAIADTVGADMQTAQSVGSSLSNGLSSLLSGDFSAAAASASEAFSTIQGAVADKMRAAGDVAGSIADAIGGALGFPGLGDTVRGVFDAIGNAIQNPMEAAKNFVGGIIDAIKGFFSFSISWPHIPVPHFGISPAGWGIGDLLKGSIPSLSINWYAKGGIVDGPTLIGAGEAGREAIVPLTQPNLKPWAEAVAREMASSDGVVVHVTVNATVSGNADAYQLGQQIGAGVASRLKQRGVAYA